MRKQLLVISIFMASLLPGVASANETQVHSTTDSEVTTLSLTLPKGGVLIQAFLQANLVDDAIFKPFSISPDIWYGVTDDLSVGLVHSSFGTTGLFGAVGSSLCLHEDSCSDVYSNVGLDGRYTFLRQHNLTLAANAGVFALSLDPDLLLDLKLGVVGRYETGKLAILFNPNILIGVTERDNGNEDFVNVPISFNYIAHEKFTAGLQVGFQSPIEDMGDLWRIPVSLGVSYAASSQLGLFAAFSLPSLAAGDSINQTGFDSRTFTLGANYSL